MSDTIIVTGTGFLPGTDKEKSKSFFVTIPVDPDGIPRTFLLSRDGGKAITINPSPTTTTVRLTELSPPDFIPSSFKMEIRELSMGKREEFREHKVRGLLRIGNRFTVERKKIT